MFDNLKALAAVVDNKSLTKAASWSSLTQSAISRRIQQLEETVGGALLDRNQRPPSPTALGRRVYEQSLPILRAVADLISLTRKMRRRPAPCGSALAGWGGRIRTSAFRVLSEPCSLNFHMIGADLMAPHLLSSALLRDGLVR
jgi:hypothetical protein